MPHTQRRNRSGHESIIGVSSSLANGLPDIVADVEASLQEHERALSQTREAGARLRQHRNSLHFTHQLPPEVLISVFQYFLPDIVSRWSHEPLSYLLTYTFSWICHYWRSAALSAPGLWSAPLFSRPSFASEMLHRARLSPLTVINWQIKNSRVIQTLKSALQSGSRIRHLALGAHESTLRDLIAAFDGPALQLENLELSFQSDSAYMPPDNVLHWEKDTLMGGCAPRLRRLTLDRCTLDSDSALYTNLTHLVIDHTVARPRIDVNSALQILAKACSLVTLDIEGIDPSHEELPPRKIVLQKLQHLLLGGQDVHVSAPQLLSVVDIRHPTRLSFSNHEDYRTILEFTGLVEFVGRRASIINSPPLISLGLRSEDHIEDYSVHVRMGTQQHASYLHFSSLRDEPPELGFVLAVICEAIPMQDISILDVDAWGPYSAPTEDEWLATLAACPALRRICVRNKALPSFVLVLSSQGGRRVASLSSRLQALVLAKAKLAYSVGDRTILAHVHGFLEARHAEGRPLHTVDFQQCYHPDPRLVERLAPFAQINFDRCEDWEDWEDEVFSEDEVDSEDEVPVDLHRTYNRRVKIADMKEQKCAYQTDTRFQ